ncbi:uncharacterized protein JN550_012625 [Neoarthrinium moseri]|uniref:uncharacterized protein n=1 Tax=Neoarthrinium moseri TaxID=1658444 RepID=UPI001FDB76B8|nr:uncharacterized protein JN550_012625 [Neoarthrinium moseri]KAI1858492.1 hypothetical protein JN550_012625 [Neoarthrinium moseri]
MSGYHDHRFVSSGSYSDRYRSIRRGNREPFHHPRRHPPWDQSRRPPRLDRHEPAYHRSPGYAGGQDRFQAAREPPQDQLPHTPSFQIGSNSSRLGSDNSSQYWTPHAVQYSRPGTTHEDVHPSRSYQAMDHVNRTAQSDSITPLAQSGSALMPIKIEDPPKQIKKTATTDNGVQQQQKDAPTIICRCGGTRAEPTDQEPETVVHYSSSKRTNVNRSPELLPPTDVWWLPIKRKIRLLEICLRMESAYFKSTDSEIEPDDAFWTKVMSRFNNDNEGKRFSCWEFARAYILDLCKDRQKDIRQNNLPAPSGDVDRLARIMDKWARLMIRREAHRTLEMAKENFWMAFGGMLQGSLVDVGGVDAREAREISVKVKTLMYKEILDERERIENQFQSRASRRE